MRPDPDMRFDRAVPVQVRSNQINQVHSVREAAETLLYKWPVEGGPKHRAARRACLKALQGLVEARGVRAALVAAAKESGILAKGVKH